MKRRFETATDFIVGTIGQPGEREFYLQFKFENDHLSFLIEKQQVAALVDRLGILMKDLKSRGISFSKIDLPTLRLPLISEFAVSDISISWNLDLKRVMISIGDETESNECEVFITPDNVLSFVETSLLVIAAGRATCPYCALPINRDGHLCPRANGYRR